MKNIFVNLESGEGVMIFTENEKITPEVVFAGLKQINYDVVETYEVRDDELQYYCYDPLWTDANFERNILRYAEQWFAGHREEVSV